jgi:hypothetical protein
VCYDANEDLRNYGCAELVWSKYSKAVLNQTVHLVNSEISSVCVNDRRIGPEAEQKGVRDLRTSSNLCEKVDSKCVTLTPLHVSLWLPLMLATERTSHSRRNRYSRLSSPAFVAMVKTANLGNGNDRPSFRWLHRPRLRRVLLQS